MYIIFIPIIIIALTIAFSIWQSNKRKHRITSRQQWAFQFIHTARFLVEHLPQHRGMANAFLKGDASFEEKLKTLHIKIEEDFSDLQQITEHQLSVLNIDDLHLIHSEWRSIKETLYGLDPETSFSRHTLLISSLLDKIEDIAELVSLYEYDKTYHLLIKAVISDLPRLTESLGQARGIGTGIATLTHCSIADQIKLNFLSEKCSVIFKNTVTPLLNSNNKALSSHEDSLRHCLDSGQSFIISIHDDLINAQKIEIDPTQYYDNATRAIEESFKLFDSLLATVKQ